MEDYSPAPAQPIFVVGMPRSGTTLIESILAAHPKVIGVGELTALPAIHNELLLLFAKWDVKSLTEIDKSQRQTWRDQYFSNYPDIKDSRFAVDKQPMNFQSLGLIKLLFPESVVIHIRRNPIDTGFSIYRNDFSKAWGFSTKLENIAHCYGEYARTMRFWEQNANIETLTIQYENLVRDFERQARKLIEYCGLDWRDECLRFHSAKRPVGTFSSVQVRKPMRKEVMSAQKSYGTLLQPLINGLKAAGVDLETGELKVE